MTGGSGMTLVEVLMALAVFLVLASAAAGLQVSAMTMQGRAEALREATEALEEATLPAASRRAGWDACEPWRARSLPGTCRAELVSCCGEAPLQGLTVRVRQEGGHEAVLLRVWARSSP